MTQQVVDPPSAVPRPQTPTTADPAVRRAALGLAVSHHGLANHAVDTIPATPEKVIETAQMFAAYLTHGTIPGPRQKRR